MRTFTHIIIPLLLPFLWACQERKHALLVHPDPTTEQSSQLKQITDNKFSTGKEYLKFSDVLLKNSELEFTIRWDGSWRDENSYDAAWVFVKYLTEDGIWRHANLKTGSAKQLTKESDLESEAELKVSPDAVGMMIYRKQVGEGDNEWRILVALDIPVGQSIKDIKVYGLEMVYVNEGAFELGTLKSIRERREVLTPGAGGAPYNPFFTYSSEESSNYGGIYEVNSEAPIEIGPSDGNLYWIDANITGTNTFSGIPQGNLPEAFPKGYQGFYQMKYELSQQEYCDFLNSLTPTQRKNRDFTAQVEYKRPISDYRNAIKFDGSIYTTSRPNRPCNFISWLDGQAYADWAGLRHMTELEFEKSCRGPEKAVYREYVWGVNEIDTKSNMQYSTTIYQNNGEMAGLENGLEFTNGNIHASMFSYFNMEDVCDPKGRFYDPDCAGCRSFSGGDGGRGPLRKGIFGMNSKSKRTKAGATYYGAMEMGGNLQEPVVTVGHPSGRRFEGSHGDGILSNDGFATNLDWKPIDNDYAFGGRGGCWKFHENHARTADRFKGLRTKPNRRASHIGFRGVRTAF